MAAAQGLHAEARLQIPKLNGLIAGARQQKVFVGEEGAPTYLMLVACEGFLGDECLQIPHFDGQVGGAGRQERPIPIESYKVNDAGMALHGALMFSLLVLPQPNAGVLT